MDLRSETVQGLNSFTNYQKKEKNMDTLLEILQDLHPEVDFETCDTLVDDKIIDSFDIVSIISEINEEFDVVIPAEEIIPENFNSAEALYDLIQRLGDE
jgi:acyl carrier protein